jgi:DNA gyrase subunit A
LIALTLDGDDELGWVKLTHGHNEVVIVSHSGQAIRFDENDVRPMGRTAAGVGAMRLRANDEIRGMDIVDPEADLLVVTVNGFAKRTPLREYALQGRNGSGVRTLSKDMQKTGNVMAARVVSNEGDLTLISRDGMMLRIAIKNISRQSRATQGVRVMSLKRDDVVASVAVLAPKAKEVDSDQDEAEDSRDGLTPSSSPIALPEATPKTSVNGH